jgi:2-polyprenyl-3-methyl-5-hydroxy-6-metoxy-1,4-benzoquinol methylase
MKPLDRFLQRWRIAKASRYIPNGASVLDIGCGDGAMFKILGHRIESGLGLDPILTKSISTPKYRLLPYRFPENIPDSDKFDVITMLAVFEHLPQSILSQCDRICSRLLHSGGYLIITIPSKYVDTILLILKSIKLVEAETLDEHHQFDVSMVSDILSDKYFRLVIKKKFQLGLNNLFVFQKRP